MAGLSLVAAVVVAGAAIYLIASLTTEYSYWSRILVWRGAAFDDFETKFPARTVANAGPPRTFGPPATPPSGFDQISFLRISDRSEHSAPTAEFVERTGTRALLALKDGELRCELYAHGASRDATMSSFSIAKSALSALVGIAIAEGRIGGLDEPLTVRLPEFADQPDAERICLRHLLSMTSGIRYNGGGMGGGPFGDDARAYYAPDLRRLALSARPDFAPGARWQYNNFNPLLLGLILERATGQSVSDYLSQKIWTRLGAEAPASWSLDSRRSGFEKMESGLNARAVDFVKFGLLFLDGGARDGRQIVPRAWVEASTCHDPAVAGPASSPPGQEWARMRDYGYLWWLDPKAPGRFYGMGNLGQVLYVAPDRNAVLARFGGSFADVDWVGVLRGLAAKLS